MCALSMCDFVAYSIMSDRRSHIITTTLTILSQKIYCISHTQPRLEWKMKSSVVCEHLFAHEQWCQTTVKTCFLAICILYFAISNEYASGKCIAVKVCILIRKCSGVKVKVDRNIKTQVKYR